MCRPNANWDRSKRVWDRSNRNVTSVNTFSKPNLDRSEIDRNLGVFIWRRASPLYRDPASQLNSLLKCIFVYMRGGPALLRRDLAIDYPRSRLRGLEIFHINALKRAGPHRRASKSKLRTHDKFFLGQHFLGYNFSFYTFCLFMCRL